ncbi:MAG TPA: hypothetical protein VEC19_15955 [Usitatibacter sp.]|nr:hypothetical protein [Usitatibacter sp.]
MAPKSPKPPMLVEVWRRVHLGEGIELQVEPGRAGLTPRQVRELVKRTREVYEELSREGDD